MRVLTHPPGRWLLADTHTACRRCTPRWSAVTGSAGGPFCAATMSHVARRILSVALLSAAPSARSCCALCTPSARRRAPESSKNSAQSAPARLAFQYLQTRQYSSALRETKHVVGVASAPHRRIIGCTSSRAAAVHALWSKPLLRMHCSIQRRACASRMLYVVTLHGEYSTVLAKLTRHERAPAKTNGRLRSMPAQRESCKPTCTHALASGACDAELNEISFR